MVWSTGSTSAYSNTVPANSTPKTRQSSARLSSGHHSTTVLAPTCTGSNPVPRVHLYSPSSILFTDLAFMFSFIFCTHAPPLPHPRPHVHLFRRFKHPVPCIIISVCRAKLSSHDTQCALASLLLVLCFKFIGHFFSDPHTRLVDTPINVTYIPCTVRSLLLQS